MAYFILSLAHSDRPGRSMATLRYLIDAQSTKQAHSVDIKAFRLGTVAYKIGVIKPSVSDCILTQIEQVILKSRDV